MSPLMMAVSRRGTFQASEPQLPPLAFLLLQKLGQTRVAVLIDSVDDWGLGGFPLAEEATTVGPRKSPQDLATRSGLIPPMLARAS